jgi:hypothetical protein
MIKFFRKIRQNLLSEGKTGKYLKYAIGEIILVVIGILIALSINNWNENRKTSLKEASNLKSIKSELESSLQEIRTDYGRILKYKQSTLNIYRYIQEKPALVDSMYLDFHNSIQFSFFFPKTSTYETFKSGNLDLIKSDSLRMLIIDIYEAGYVRIKTKVGSRRNAANVLFPYYQKHFTTKLIPNSDENHGYTQLGIPNDYQHLLYDSEFETLIAEAMLGRSMEVDDFERTIEWIEKGIEEIDRYLKKN